MARVKRQEQRGDFAEFLRLVEGEAPGFAVECVRPGGDDHHLRAMLLLDPTLTLADKQELRRKIGAAGTGIASTFTLLEKQGGSVETDTFRGRVARELERVKKSRIPCGLLLIRMNGVGIDRAIPLMAETIDCDSPPARCDESTAALLLPAMSRRKVMELAERLHDACVAKISKKVCIAGTLCTARDVPETDAFIARAMRELTRAKDEGWRVFHSFPAESDRSCQVTAEERAQLFTFLHGGKKG